jgi:hypothetical protein
MDVDVAVHPTAHDNPDIGTVNLEEVEVIRGESITIQRR